MKDVADRYRSRWKAGDPLHASLSIFSRWSDDGSFEKAFIASVEYLEKVRKAGFISSAWRRHKHSRQKRGDLIGYSGYKDQKGEKIIALIDNNGNIIAPMAAASVNEADIVLLHPSFQHLKDVFFAIGITLAGAIFNLDSGFDSKRNRRLFQRFGMKPNIKENLRNRQRA